jgi:lipooligosaccharide transport system permease protein
MTTMRSAMRVLEGHAVWYRHTWRASVITTFLNPVLYLGAMGLGLGTLVDAGTGETTLDGFTYLAFLAPGLLAAAAMQTGTGDSSFPVMAGMKWVKTYEAALSTPVGIRALVYGHLGWVMVRLALTTVVFAIVMSAFGAAPVGRSLYAVLPALLTGFAFAAPVTAYTAALQNEYGLSSLFRFGIVPMFLFSGTFFPVTQLPGWMQPVAYITPLWNGVVLTRAAALGAPTEWSPLLHVGYLLLWVAAGIVVAIYNFERRLEK